MPTLSAFAPRWRTPPGKTRSPSSTTRFIIAPMLWIAPSEKDTANAVQEKRPLVAADTATRVSASHKCEAAEDGAVALD